MHKALLVLASVWLAFSGHLAFAQPAPTNGAGPRITEVDLDEYPQVTMVVELPGSSSFDPDQFAVTENGAPVTGLNVQQLAGASGVQVATMVAIDTSGSMEGLPLEEAKKAAAAFVGGARPEDRIALMTFGESIQYTPFTNVDVLLQAFLADAAAVGETPLYDAVIKTSELLTRSKLGTLERNLVILSDGKDSSSQAPLELAVAALRREGINVFGVGLAGAEYDAQALRALAGEGLVLETTDPTALKDLFGQVQSSLAARVIVHFTAATAEPGDVELAVSYGGLSTTSIQTVPGIESGPGATLPPSFSVPAPAPTSQPALDLSTLRNLSLVAMGLAAGLFVFLLAGSRSPSGGELPGRLQAYGEQDKPKAHASLFSRMPLVSRVAKQAEEVADKRGFLQPIASMLEQANLMWRPGEAVAGAIAVAGILAGLYGFKKRNGIDGVLAFVVLLGGVVFAIRLVASRERKRFENQLPSTLNLVASSLRSGQSFLQAMESVAQESPNPTAREFQRSVAEVRLGRSIGVAMEGISTRMDSPDFTWVVMATEIQREVGGNLAEVLDVVSDTMLQRNRLRRDIKAMSAEGRISAMVLMAIPFLMFFFLYTSNRPYIQPLFSSRLGFMMIGASLALIAAAGMWLRKILDIEV